MYADVIIDINTASLDRTFQYRIPYDMMGEVCVGSMVKVHFGNAKALKRGYVVSLSSEPVIDEEKIRNISEVCDVSDMAEPRLVKLAAWMAKTYGCTFALALRTVFPVKQKINPRTPHYLQLSADAEKCDEFVRFFEKKNQRARLRLFAALMENREIPEDIARDKLNINKSVIDYLISNGLCERSENSIYLDEAKEVKRPVLNAAQQTVVDGILSGMDDLPSDNKGSCEDHYLGNPVGTTPRVSLIHGITGSGKTEVYLSLSEAVVAQGGQVIMLIPEIALTYQMMMRFYERFKDRVSSINSKLSAGEKYERFMKASRGEVDVMIGPRSALFTPFSNLKLIILDEEHEDSYKSGQTPMYHARETAIELAKMSGAAVVLGSATPSVDSYYRALKGEYSLYTMNERATGAALPEVEITDLRAELIAGNKSPISRLLYKRMAESLSKKEQVMLFLNRRGYAGFVSCRACGFVYRCPHCDVTLFAHGSKYGTRLKCHYCGHEIGFEKKCPECSSKYIGVMKAGTEAMEIAVKKLFPEAKVLRMDRDTTAKKGEYEKILSSFADHEADILIGTQMIVKGHDFPEVTCVGILAADLSLYAPDHRAGERTFQLLTQACGRAGRADKPGHVVIQTYNPKDPYILAGAAQDYAAFYEREIVYREMLEYPPVINMLALLFESKDKELALRVSQDAAGVIGELMTGDGTGTDGQDYMAGDRDDQVAGDFESDVPQQNRWARPDHVVIGPADASIAYINDVHRRTLYVKSKDITFLEAVQQRMNELEKSEAYSGKVRISCNLNPMNLI